MLHISIINICEVQKMNRMDFIDYDGFPTNKILLENKLSLFYERKEKMEKIIKESEDYLLHNSYSKDPSYTKVSHILVDEKMEHKRIEDVINYIMAGIEDTGDDISPTLTLLIAVVEQTSDRVFDRHNMMKDTFSLKPYMQQQ